MEFECSSAGGVEVTAALTSLHAALDRLTSGGWWQVSEGELAAAVVELHRVESRVAAAQVGAIAEAIARGLPAVRGAAHAGAWLRGLIPVTPSQAQARAELAELLPAASDDADDPATASAADQAAPDGTQAPSVAEADPGWACGGDDDGAAGDSWTGPAAGPRRCASLGVARAAFDRGDVSAAQAGVLARTSVAIDAIPGRERGSRGVDEQTKGEALGVLLGFADRLDVAQLGKAAARARFLLDRDAGARLARDEEVQQEAQGAWLVPSPSTGMWHGRLDLAPVEGAFVHSVVDVLSKPQPAKDGTADPRSAARRRAEAFVTMARLALAALPGQPGALPSRHGSPVRLVACADLATLKANLQARHGLAGVAPATVETGQPGGQMISALTAQVLACDADVVPTLTDHQGRALDVGNTIYAFPTKVRQAIEHRDRHCTYPGCTAPAPWCHGHHLIRHPDGPTSEDNGTLLCGRHHRCVHAQGWTGTITDGHVVWRPPGPGDPPLPANAHTQHIEHALDQLAQRWLTRNPELHDTG